MLNKNHLVQLEKRKNGSSLKKNFRSHEFPSNIAYMRSIVSGGFT